MDHDENMGGAVVSLHLAPLQEAWLAEIGVDAQWLARLRPASKASEPAREAEVTQRAAAPLPAAAPETVPVSASPAPRAPESRRVRSETPKVPAPGAVADVSGLDDLQALAKRIRECETCSLHVGRSHAVPGAGCEQAPEYLIVGEMPGVEDDLAGEPFQGAAGVLLRAMLASAGVLEDRVFMTDVIRCRPAGGRSASAAEVASCLPYLQRQISILRPQRILALGRLAAQALLGSRASLASLRGHEQRYRTTDGLDIPVWVTHHPASLLLRPSYKAEAWRDLMSMAAAEPSPISGT